MIDLPTSERQFLFIACRRARMRHARGHGDMGHRPLGHRTLFFYCLLFGSSFVISSVFSRSLVLWFFLPYFILMSFFRKLWTFFHLNFLKTFQIWTVFMFEHFFTFEQFLNLNIFCLNIFYNWIVCMFEWILFTIE
jgi:hypothetical protein